MSPGAEPSGRSDGGAGERREARVAQIQERLDSGEYRVDPEAVAEAIILRLRAQLRRAPSEPPQNECS